MNDELNVVVRTKEEAHLAARQVYALAQSIIENGNTATIRAGEDQDPISIKQRGFLHAAVFPQIAEQVTVDGVRYTAEVWKQHLKNLFLPDTWEMRRALVWDAKTGKLRAAKKATPHRIKRSTEELGIKAYSKFIDDCIDHAALNWSVVFVFKPSEREAVRYAAKPRKTAVVREEVPA
jgi:hypothetical protein